MELAISFTTVLLYGIVVLIVVGALSGLGSLLFIRRSRLKTRLDAYEVPPAMEAHIDLGEVIASAPAAPADPAAQAAPGVDVDGPLPSITTDEAAATQSEGPPPIGRSARGVGSPYYVPSPSPTRAPQADPDRLAYALLDCSDSVVQGEEFRLDVGLSPTPMRGVTGDAFTVPDPASATYVLTVQLVADGCELREGESWTLDLEVSQQDPYPHQLVHLTALMEVEEARATRISAQYSIAGQLLGFADRLVAVLAAAGITPPPPTPPEATTIAFPQGADVPDLTISIEKLPEIVGELRWRCVAAGPNGSRTEAALSSNIADEPREFARLLVNAMSAIEGQPGVNQRLAGLGARISQNFPTGVWAAITAAGQKAAPNPPSILFVSEEPYVPWELAQMENPFDPAAPPFLAAQADVGRWVLARRPGFPPPTDQQVTDFAVISGTYDPKLAPDLTWATAEAAELLRVYGASSTNADHPSVSARLVGPPSPDAVHFAVHGTYDPGGVEDGLYLTDQMSLIPSDVEGMRLSSGRPVVFLNACQVGAGNAVLGDYSGLGEAFLFAGATAVIAPLWSVSDEKAHDVALAFYREIFNGERPAAALRRIRAQWIDKYDTDSATEMAYQYFGHPLLRVSGPANQVLPPPAAVP